MVNVTQYMTKLEGHPMAGLTSSHVFSQCLKLISGAYMLKVNKHARWIQL